MAASKRIRFSKRSVDALKAKRKRYFVYDVTTANLCVCVSPVDIRTFYRYGRIDGRPVRYRLGAYPEMSVQQARKVCAKVTSDVLDGRNPQHERQEQRKSMTLGALFDDYLARHAKIHKKTWQQDRNQFDAYLPTLKGRRICDIRRRGAAARCHRPGSWTLRGQPPSIAVVEDIRLRHRQRSHRRKSGPRHPPFS